VVTPLSEPSRTQSYLGFIGVSTEGSSIRKVFPEWADALGLPTRTLVGHDVPLDSAPEVYREVVESIRDDPESWGALITTHKVAVHANARDLFDSLDELAETFGEISCISKRRGRLVGSAKDPVTARLTLEEFLPSDHFSRTGGAALILGSGGAGTALSHQLGVRADRPGLIICTAISQAPLDHARAVHERAGIPDGLVCYVVTSNTTQADQLLRSLPPSSLVVNATGMGKDRPGSPVSDRVVFPERGVVWEFNYRGPLDFLHQARRQQDERSLHVEDGWRYFVHGWTQAVAEVFDVPMPAATVDELGRIATRLR
jgi:shikimate dehydrogenase